MAAAAAAAVGDNGMYQVNNGENGLSSEKFAMELVLSPLRH